MSHKLKCRDVWLLSVTFALAVVGGSPAFAWDVQERITNESSDQKMHDLTKFVFGAQVTGAISNQLGTPSITTHTTPGGVQYSVIHWAGGTPVQPGDSVWGCFNLAPGAAPTGLVNALWSDENGVFKEVAAVEVSITPEVDPNGDTSVILEHTWSTWLGEGFPPGPEDDIGEPLGPINGTDVFYAVTDQIRPLEELNEGLFDDPAIEWIPLPNFQLPGGGATTTYPLGSLLPSDVVLLRFVAHGEGLSTQTIHQFQTGPVAPIPTVSEWGLIILSLLLLAAGTIVIRRAMVQSQVAAA